MHVALLKINSFQLLFKSIRKHSFLLLLLIAGLGMDTFAQPANDDPCNAIPLVADVVCNFQVFTTQDATASAGVPAPGCANYQGGDVWFQVIVPAASNGNLKFDTQAGVVTDLGMAIYRGTCGNLQLIQCDDDGGAGLMSQITLNSLTVGSTLWVRCWEYGNNGNGTFGICVKYPGPPPAYDEPCTATALPNPTTTCSYSTFTTESATASAGVPAPGCANYQGGDVWFTVTVPAGGTLKFDTQTGEMTDGGMAIYNGPCTNLTLIACDDNSSPNGNMPQIVASGLTPGSTVWIRVWSAGNATANIGSFGLCVSIPPPPPANDNPCTAIALTAASTCSYTTFTTASATGTTGVPAPGCANYSGGDVWFTVVVPCDGKLIIDTQTGVVTDGGMAAYRGATCSNLQLIQCDDDGSANGLMPRLSLTSLTPGSTIWVRFWEYGNDNPGTFGICVSIPPPPAQGTSCFGGQPFCSSNTYTYNNSTNVPSLGGGGIYGCLGSTPNPAWYYMQLQTSGSLNILIQQTNTNGQIVDVDYALWGPFPTLASSCNNLSAGNIVSCSYSISGTETATLANGQAGEFYILLITNFSNQPGTVTFNQSSGTGSTNCDIVCTLTSGNSGPICPGQTVDLTASTIAGATYQWNGPNCFNQTPLSTQQNPTGVFVPSAPGQYIFWVTATFAGGSSCTSYDTVTVIPAPVFGLDTTVNICAGNAQDLYAVIDTTGLTTAWTTYPGGVSVTTPDSVTVGGIYQLIGINASSCADTVLVTLVIDTVTISISPVNPVICLGQSVTLTANSNSATIFSWSPVTFLSDPANAVTIASPIQDSTTYIVTASLNSCSVQDSVKVYVEQATTGADTSIIVCAGSTVDLTTIYNTTGFTTAWTTLPGGVSVANPASVGTAGTYQIIATTPGGCTDTAVVTVTIDVVSATVTSTGNATCTIPGQITVTNPSGIGSIFDYNIDITPGVFQSSNIFTPVPGTYVITTRDSIGCTTTSTVTVNFINDLTLSVRSDTTICLGQSVTLTANSTATNYSWTPIAGLSAPTSQTTIATPADSTTYTVTATLGSCVQTASVKITVDKNLTVDAGGPIFVDAGGSAQILATLSGANTNVTSILWTPATDLSATNILNPVVTPTAVNGTATYDITVINTSGCSATDELLVNILPNCRNVRNAFTPNGDGINDLWFVYDDYSCLKNVTVHVYNRYGSKVFESKDYKNTWDGRFSGKSLPDGTYYGVVEFTLFTGRKITVRTDLTVLR